MKAIELAKQQKEISISEFFEKNRHLLGYDNKTKALLIIVKEGVDNALDAAEEAGILPEIYVRVREVSEERYEIVIRDNGPGIVKKQIPRIFGKLLYGSKFHRLKQSRGQQGIGISAATLYSQLTTGTPLEIKTSIGDGKTHLYKIKIDVKNNEPIINEKGTEESEGGTGTEIRFLAEGLYREHRQSILEYMRQTAISNPHAHITFDSPKGRVEFERGVEKLPREPREIRPHLHGVELGILMRMLGGTKAKTLSGFLTSEFTRVGRTSATEICKRAGLPENSRPKKISDEEAKRIMSAVRHVKILKPPLDCLSPLGKDFITKGMEKELKPEWIWAVTRPPAVYRGWPFQVEVGIAYGGDIDSQGLMRFANRVPLLYQAGDCAITKSVNGTDWKRYGLSKKLEEDPVSFFVHIVSVWVPFTSESKEAIASYPAIVKEIKLALQECARKMGSFLSGKRKEAQRRERIRIFDKYAVETVNAISNLTDIEKVRVREKLQVLIDRKTEGLKRKVNDDINKGDYEIVTVGEDSNGGKGREKAEGDGAESPRADREEGKPKNRSANQVTLERVF